MGKHIVILGGGIIGLSAAAECVRRGHRVTVIERNGAQRDGCSKGNGGMVVPSPFIPLAAPGMVQLGLKMMWNSRSPFYIRPRLDGELWGWAWRFWKACTPRHVERAGPLLRDLNLASRDAFIKAAEAGENFGLATKGLLMLCKTPRGLEDEAHVATAARALGIPAEVLDAQQTARLDPGITMDIAGSVYFPLDCHLQPERYHAALERRISAGGGSLMVDTTVTGWRREGNRLVAVQTTRGDVAGDEFVLSGGAWSSAMVRPLGLRLPMQAGKGYSLTVPNPVERPQICAILTEARLAVTPMGNTLRFAGTMEIAGLDETVTRSRVEGILDSIPRYYPRFGRDHFTGLQPWHGLRPCSPDGVPYLGRTGAASNLIVATGHAMMGLSLAPVSGEIVAELVDGAPCRFDLTLLSPDRYA